MLCSPLLLFNPSFAPVFPSISTSTSALLLWSAAVCWEKVVDRGRHQQND
jgi:hypothetical protein